MTTFEQQAAALMTQIKVEMAGRSMTQQDLADAVGVGRPAMNNYLRGHKSMPMKTVYGVAAAFGLSPAELLLRAEARIQPQEQTA
jgi:transcriptional regulator with XRE-family HTH domain